VQRKQVLTWIAADYDTELIRKWMKDRDWPTVTPRTITFYRKKYGPTIQELREQRYSEALTTGLAKKEERVERLKGHVDELHKIMWDPGWHGRLYNEKAWRETIQQIADEMEPKSNVMDHTGTITHKIEFEEAVKKIYGQYNPDTLPDSD
jgi:hypothetical protein